MPRSFLKRHALGIGLLCAMAGGVETAAAETIVAAGHSATLMTVASIDQVCHSLGAATINVLEPPHGGFLEVLQTKAYPNFNALNTRSRCNTLKLPATEVVYQSAGNFLGPDAVTLEIILPGGGARRVRLAVSVRPVTTNFEAAPPAGAETLAPEASAPAVPDHPKTPVHRKKRTVAAVPRRHPEVPVKAAPPTPPAAPKDPMVNT